MQTDDIRTLVETYEGFIGNQAYSQPRVNESIERLQALCPHDELEYVDASFDHAFGTETILYNQCIVCNETFEIDNEEPYED